MKNSICVIISLSMLLSINNTYAQKTNTCEVVVWKGRKAHYTAEKIALSNHNLETLGKLTTPNVPS